MLNGFMTSMRFSNVTDPSFWNTKYAGNKPRYSPNDPLYGKGGLLARTLLPLLKGAKNILEIGCGSSRYMIFFNMVADLDTYGLDFSREGLHNLQMMSAPHGIRHKLYFGDMFEHEAEGQKFDVVFHAGLVEHFSDLNLFFKRCRFFTKNDGIMIFTMPNMQNLAWRWHRRLCPVNFGAHIKYTKDEINQEASRYFNITLSRPWGYPQVYAGGPPESALAKLLKFVNITIIVGLSFPPLGYKGSVGKRLASAWLFICRAK